MSRTTFAAAAVVALLALGAALFVVGGGPSPTPSEEPSPSLQGVVPPSSTPSGPSAGPTASPVTNPAGVWIATGTMGSPRINHTAVRLLDGRVLVVGGERGSNGGAVTSVELYDPVTGTWSATGQMLKTHEGFPATLLRDGRVLVGGIEDTSAIDAISTAEVYDPDSGTWTATGQMIGDGHGTATLLRDGKVLVAGTQRPAVRPRQRDLDRDGGDDHTALSPHGHAAVRWQGARGGRRRRPRCRWWTRPSCMTPTRGPGPRSRTCTPSASPSGPSCSPMARCSWSGPAGTTRSPLSCTTRSAGAWIATGSMVAPRFNYAAASLADGKVLVVGGNENSDVLASAELYDPGTGTWTSTAPMLRSHGSLGERGTPIIPLLDGTVLVAGGQDCLDGVCVATGSAELYVPAGVSPPPLPPSRPRLRQSSRPLPRARRRSRPRPVPFRRTRGPGTSRSTTRAPSPRHCSWPRRTRAGCHGSSGPRPRTWSRPAPP